MPNFVGITVLADMSSTTVAFEDWLRPSHCFESTGNTELANDGDCVMSWFAGRSLFPPMLSRSHLNQGTICRSSHPRASRSAFDIAFVNLNGIVVGGTGISAGILEGFKKFIIWPSSVILVCPASVSFTTATLSNDRTIAPSISVIRALWPTHSRKRWSWLASKGRPSSSDLISEMVMSVITPCSLNLLINPVSTSGVGSTGILSTNPSSSVNIRTLELGSTPLLERTSMDIFLLHVQKASSIKFPTSEAGVDSFHAKVLLW